MNSNSEIVIEVSDLLRKGRIPPWKAESYIKDKYAIGSPDNILLAAKARRAYLEDISTQKFEYLKLREKPYLIDYSCDRCSLDLRLAAYDEYKYCPICGSKLTVSNPIEYYPLTANYIGGIEDYYSFCGRIEVKGDVEKTFNGILQYGTGLGPIGVTRGAYFINHYGGAVVKVMETARACRNLGYVFRKEETRRKSIGIIEAYLSEVRLRMNQLLSKWKGKVSFVEILPVEDMGKLYLFIDFTAEFKYFRGHGAISKAVGLAKKLIDEKLKIEGIPYELSAITQGYDGDLKPSPRNKRGRYVLVEVTIPMAEIEKITGKKVDKFIDFVSMDAKGTEKLGWFHHTGMGGEIVAGVYKAVKINPHSPLVTSTERIFSYPKGDNIVYGIELPNVEAGTISSDEGAITPLGREIIRVIGIRNSKEFSAYLGALVLAGEFNLSVEIVRENLYRVE